MVASRCSYTYSYDTTDVTFLDESVCKTYIYLCKAILFVYVALEISSTYSLNRIVKKVHYLLADKGALKVINDVSCMWHGNAVNSSKYLNLIRGSFV